MDRGKRTSQRPRLESRKECGIDLTKHSGCPICLDECQCAVITNCNHVFCGVWFPSFCFGFQPLYRLELNFQKGCILDFWERMNRGTLTCPICRFPSFVLGSCLLFVVFLSLCVVV
jgi:hypothetical protein